MRLKVVAVSGAQETKTRRGGWSDGEHKKLCEEIIKAGKRILELNGKDIVFTKPTE